MELNNIKLAMVGHSLLTHFPLDSLPPALQPLLTINAPNMLPFYVDGHYKKLLDHRPRLNTVIFIIGGNDIDSLDHTTEHLRDISHAFMRLAIILVQKGIKPFFLPIQPRTSPKYTTKDRYIAVADKINHSLSEFFIRQLHYCALIDCQFGERSLRRDGIHFTQSDYSMVTSEIVEHLTHHLDSSLPPLPQLPLEKNEAFLAREKVKNGKEFSDHCLGCNCQDMGISIGTQTGEDEQ